MNSRIRNKICIFQHILTKFSGIVQKPRTVEILSSDYLFLTFYRLKNPKLFFLQQWRISVFIIFGRVWPKIENIKTRHFWRSTGVQPLKNASQLYAACKSFFLMDNKNLMLINKHRISRQLTIYVLFCVQSNRKE